MNQPLGSVDLLTCAFFKAKKDRYLHENRMNGMYIDMLSVITYLPKGAS